MTPPHLPSFLDRLPALGLSWQTHGSIRLPTGRVIACDPLVNLPRARPFARAVPPGAWPVELAVAYGDVLLATIRFSEAAVVRWEVALPEGEALPDEGPPPGFPVDSSRACFVDAAVAAALARAEEAHEQALVTALAAEGVDAADTDAWHAAADRYQEAHPSPLEPLLEEDRLVVDGVDGEVVSFPAGLGEGLYVSYWGLDAEDRPVLLLIDFGLVEPPADIADELDALEEEDVLADLAFEEEMARLEAEGALAGRDAPTDEVDAYDAYDADADEEDADEPSSAPTSPWDTLARAALARWQREGTVELVAGADVGALVDDLADLFAGGADGNALEELLLDHAAIDEIYASGADLLAAAAPG